MTRIRTRKRNRKGAATVEFALCLPILLTFVFGILEFSRVTQLQQTARLAAFEGARAGISLDAATSDVQSAVDHVMSAMSISSYNTTITPNPITFNSSSVSVSVSVSLKPTNNAWFTTYVSASSSITANVTLLREVNGISVP